MPRFVAGFVPIGSMYGIYANIGDLLMVNVTIYSIHGSYGIFFNVFFVWIKVDLIKYHGET